MIGPSPIGYQAWLHPAFGAGGTDTHWPKVQLTRVFPTLIMG
jgi:hypothetical protein